MNDLCYGLLDESPVGHLWVAAADCGLVAITFRGREETFVDYVQKLTQIPPRRDPAAVSEIIAQLRQYLSGQRQAFDVPLCWEHMTPFQRQVLKLVAAVPYGRLTTYHELAEALGDLKAIRAVGQANATNPLPLVIPCHRVIGSDGSLRGYGGGLETKAWLLRMEGSWLL